MNERKQNPSFRRGKILIVEDETLVAWDIEQSLRDLGFCDIDNVSTLAAARVALALPNIALAIVDIKLADGDGSNLIADCQSLNVPVLVITGYAHFRNPDVPVLLKPFSVADLKQNVLKLVGCGSRL